jgi:2-octaprenyl-3-methyl-6-methoxy-1,4-benzoquinol hydroxylase
MMTTMDLFYRVFGNTTLPARMFRNIGLGLAERIVPAKKLAMKYAMGLNGQLPRLARGEAILG